MHPAVLCTVCEIEEPKYTCPGCSTRTCSLPCSNLHKSSTGCTGKRNKASYVPMNKYSWGTMMDDYVFLEDVGRRVKDWGSEIVKGGYRNSNVNSFKGKTNNPNPSGASRGSVKGKDRGGNLSKRDILKMRLEAKDIEVELLPLGMDKRKLNQSSWDSKKQTAFLTIEFIFHKPRDPSGPSSHPPYTLFTHKNDINKPLLSLIRSRLEELEIRSKKTEAYPIWIKNLVFPDDEDPEGFNHPQCVMTASLDPTTSKSLRLPSQNAYYSFDCTRPLETLLCHTQFVEFPTIEVWEEFEGTIVDIKGVVRQEAQRPTKRVKLNHKAGKIALQGLLDGYGSSEEDEVKQEGVLATLDQYAGTEDDEIQEENGTGTDCEDEVDLETDIDPGVLIELLKSRHEAWGIKDDDAVDWGDNDSE